jgi:hypothetical protein
MTTTKKILLPAALVAALGAVPASAHDKPGHAKGPQDERHQPKPQAQQTPKHAKKAKTRAYVAHGLIQAAALTKNADGTYDGTITVDVKRTNKHGRWSKGTSQTFTLDDVKVRFGGGDTEATPGDRVTVFGRVAKVKKAKASTDTPPATTPVVTVRALKIKPPKS